MHLNVVFALHIKPIRALDLKLLSYLSVKNSYLLLKSVFPCLFKALY